MSGSYAYVTDVDGSLQVINVSNQASPTIAGSYDMPWRAAWGVAASGSYAYVADEIGGLVVLRFNEATSSGEVYLPLIRK